MSAIKPIDGSPMIGYKIRELREKHRYSQRQLAELLGAAQTTVSGWETGARSINVETLSRIAGVLGEPITELISFPAFSLNTLRDEIYADAVKHGLWEPEMSYPLDDCCELINDELWELAEAADDYEYKEASMDNFCEELADIVIMCMSIAGLHCIDIDAAIRRKMEINKGRPWKHGKREKA